MKKEEGYYIVVVVVEVVVLEKQIQKGSERPHGCGVDFVWK